LRRLRAFNHDQIIVLPLEARCRKVRGAGAQQPPVDLVALEVHQVATLALDRYLDARRLGEVIENLRGLALGKLSPIEIDAHLDTAIGRACECLQDWPVGQHIGRLVDFVPGAIDKRHVDVFKILARRIVWLNAIVFNFWLARAIEPNEAAAPLWPFGEP
jgi:hypothetical protein